MTKLKSRVSAGVLAALLFSASLLSCSDTEKQPNETQTPDTAATDAVTESVDEGPYYEPDNLPEDLDYDGITTHILGWEGSSNIEFFVEEEDGDIVNDAIFARNRTVEERLNLKLTYTLVPGTYDDRAAWVKTVSQSAMAGDGSNDIVAGYSMCGATLANNRLLIDLTEQEHIDFDKPWWPDSLIKEATCGGKLYFCSGDISTNMIYMLYAIYFNKTMAQNYDIEVESLYELVRSGEWTLDKYIELTEGMYVDLNGDGMKSPEDQFGSTVQGVRSDAYFFSSGLRTTTLDADGLPVLSEDFGGEKTQELLSRLLDCFYAKNDMFFTNDSHNIVRDQFLESRALFITNDLGFASQSLRDATVEYGILPLPKYDTAQEDYYTVSSFGYTLYGIPVDARDAAMSAAILECLASESYRTVSLALFEVALKVKYASDDNASDMYDIIRGSNVFDIGRIFNDSIGGKTYSMFRSCLINNDKSWISTYEKNAKSMEKQFEEVVENLIEEQ
ncbi:MAG: hypothetical protein E7604_09460 [Ruminococcaceae bacterium]|nr:hypothetical protein [Oscillospiraceae bacterium]